MARTKKYISLSLLVFVMSLFITFPVMAIPPLPSSFYGTVMVNATNVPDGTLIQVLIDGEVYAEGFTQIYQGDSVYVIDIPGDDSDTEKRDGGREGDSIQFKIAGVLADQTGIWHGGTNNNLDLTASSTEPFPTAQATLTAVPTQTPIVLVQPPSTSTTMAQVSVSETPVHEDQDLLTPTEPLRSLSNSGKLNPPTAMPTNIDPSKTPNSVADNDIGVGISNVSQPAAIIIVFLLVLGAGILFLYLRKK